MVLYGCVVFVCYIGSLFFCYLGIVEVLFFSDEF